MSAPLVEPSYNLTGANTNTSGGRVLPSPQLSIKAGTTATTVGAVLDCGAVFNNPAMVYVAPTGTFSTGGITLEGSLDGTNWFAVASEATPASATTVLVTAIAPCRYVRAHVTTAFTGSGASISATVSNS